MFCPNCGAEYKPGVTACGDCQVALVAQAPDNTPRFQDTVRVYESDDQGEIAIAESLLRAAEIPYVVQNALGQSVLGASSRASMIAGIEVRPEVAEAAAKLLADLNEGVAADDIDAFYDGGGEQKEEEK